MEDKELNEIVSDFYAKIRSITKFDLGLIIAYILVGVIILFTNNYTGINFRLDEFLYGLVMVIIISYWIWQSNISATVNGLVDYWNFLDREGYELVKKEDKIKKIGFNTDNETRVLKINSEYIDRDQGPVLKK